MRDIWSKPLGTVNPEGLDYWEYFGVRLVERAVINSGDKILDVGCGTGSSLFPAGEKTGPGGMLQALTFVLVEYLRLPHGLRLTSQTPSRYHT